MEIYLIRHTTPDISKGICYGQTDLTLKSTFPDETEMVFKNLPQSLDVVFTSPLFRCTALADTIAAPENIVDSRLLELNFGEWEMKAWDSLPKDQLDNWMNDFVHIAPPGGESMIELQNRVLRWWEELQSTTYNRVAVVTHAGVIRSLKSHLYQIPLQDSFTEIKVDFGDVVRVSHELE